MKKRFFYVAIVTIMSFFLLFQSAIAALSYNLKEIYPNIGDTHVPVDTSFTITFDETELRGRQISAADLDENDIYLLDQYRDKVDLKPAVIENNVSLIITPEQTLEFGKKYELVIEDNAILDKSGDELLTRDLEIPFSTYYYNFYTLMVESKISPLISQYSPRQIKVLAPKRYINEIEVLHKKLGTVSEFDQKATESVTNVDVITSSGAGKVKVVITKNGKAHSQKFADLYKTDDKESQKYFDAGFSKLPNSFDVGIYVYDKNNRLLDEKMLKVASEQVEEDENAESIIEVEETYEYETAGNGYSLYDLLKNKETFSKLLEENDMRKLKVQLVER